MMRLLALFIALFIAAGCGTPKAAEPAAQAPAGAPAEASFARDVQPVFGGFCMPCHSGKPDAASRSYDLSSYQGVLGPGTDAIPNVIPGNPDSSLLHQKLSQGKMPPSGKLGDTKIATVKDWIDKGAKNN